MPSVAAGIALEALAAGLLLGLGCAITALSSIGLKDKPSYRPILMLTNNGTIPSTSDGSTPFYIARLGADTRESSTEALVATGAISTFCGIVCSIYCFKRSKVGTISNLHHQNGQH